MFHVKHIKGDIQMNEANALVIRRELSFIGMWIIPYSILSDKGLFNNEVSHTTRFV